MWFNALRPYYRDNWGMLACPTATRPMENAGDWGTFKAYYLNLPMPGRKENRVICSYGINSWTDYMLKDRSGAHTRKLEYFWKNVNDVKGTNNNPVFGDSTHFDAWPRCFDEPPAYPDEFGIGNKGTSNEMKHFCINRHDGFVSLLFMDWTVRKVGL